MEGSKVFKNVSILWLVWGVVSLVVSGFGLVSVGKLGLSVASFWIPVILGLIWSVVQLLAGALGLKFWKQPEKAKICMLLAALAVLGCLAYNICMMVYGYWLWPVISMIAGILFAAVYLTGAAYNNKLNV